MALNQSRLAFTFLSALVVALAASYFVYQQLSGTSSVEANGQSVVVAARDLPIGLPIGAEDLKVVTWPGGSVPPGAAVDAEAVIGRALVYPVFDGEPVLSSKLAPEGSGAGLSAVISEGMRAVSIRVDEVVAVAGFVVAGTHVDVFLTGTPGNGTDQSTQLILENVQVLAAGQSIQPDSEGKPQRVNVVTVLCTPEDAAMLVLAASDGRIQLVLRNLAEPIAEEGAKPVVQRRRELYAASAPAKPVRRPPPARTKTNLPAPVVAPEPIPTSIMMIRGSQVSTIEVPSQ